LKSIEKFDRLDNLKEVIFGEFNPRTGKLCGNALVLKKTHFKFLQMGKKVCTESREHALFRLAQNAI
jgi:hypothetical protein